MSPATVEHGGVNKPKVYGKFAIRYRRIPSVEEILLIDSASVFGEVLRRAGEQWITELVQGREATLSLASIGLTLTMADLYQGIEMQDAPETRLRLSGA
jgi:Uma2 family endonuclease